MSYPTWRQVRFTCGRWGWRQVRGRARLKLYATVFRLLDR